MFLGFTQINGGQDMRRWIWS